MSDELPKLFSDEEFSKERERRERRESEDRRAAERRSEDRRSSTGGRRSSDGYAESTIEQRFPHIAKKLVVAWPSDACSAYILSMTVADRPGRQGFPDEVMEDLMMLHEINEMLIRKVPLEKEAALPRDWKDALRRKTE